MTPERLRLIEEIFHDARARSGPDRDALLASACDGDSRLRREVESLLEQAAGGLLDAGVGNVATALLSQSRPLAAGATVGSYVVEALIGAGGMGDVYRARDTRLERHVALKLLPESFSTDPERVARFVREARLLAALNHPHIAQIHGLEQAGITQFLVLELVDGEALDRRIAGGPLPIDEALGVAAQIVAALEAAHGKGIIHRDLKPANVAVDRDGQVKVFDFGLAKAIEPSSEAQDPIDSPPLASPPALTGVGIVLGTAAYMAPEQAKGRPVDKRADVWAFGCVLYEMLTGVRAFPGEDAQEILASVLARGPDWQLLPANTPPAIRRLLQRCLETDISKRFRDIGDAGLEIADVRANPAASAHEWPPTAPAHLGLTPLKAAVGAMTLILASTSVTFFASRRLLTTRSAPRAVQQLSLAFSPTSPLSAIIRQFTLSADGGTLAYVGANGRVWLRTLNDTASRELPGTDGAWNPFFSPDGEWIGYIDAGGWGGGSVARPGTLKKVAVRGGLPVVLADAVALGGTWGRDETIVFCGRTDRGLALLRIPASGGTPTPIATPASGNAESRVAWPSRLPDDSTVLFSETDQPTFENGRTVALSLRTGKRRVILEQGYGAHYMASGHLVYALNGSLMAVPFSDDRLTVTGPPVQVIDRIIASRQTGWVGMALAANGVLLYDAVPAQSTAAQTLEWVGRDASAVPILSERAEFSYPRLSPDARRLAVGAGSDILIVDLARGTRSRIAAKDRGDYPAPAITAWTADGLKLVINRRNTTDTSIAVVDPDDVERGTMLLRRPYFLQVGSWSRNGAFAFFQIPGGSERDVWVLDAGATQPRPFAATRFNERGAAFSPDGRWIAYSADTSGHDEVYVRPYPGSGAPIPVSAGGGVEPSWSRTGREIFYREGDRMMSVSFGAAPAVALGRPQVVFEQAFARSGLGVADYDVAPDGRFIMVRANRANQNVDLRAIVNWFDDLKARVPVK